MGDPAGVGPEVIVKALADSGVAALANWTLVGEASVFEQLDEREKNGYLRITTELSFDDGSHDEGLVYIATSDNEAYLGEASELDIALQIFAAQGPSGLNRDYLLDLAKSLRGLGLQDRHVFEIEKHLLQIIKT